MKSIVRLGLVLGILFPSGLAAQDQIPWAPDVQRASQAAAETNRMVLLHFYSDDCPPCRRLEQNVFTRPEVGEAVSAAFVPVKVHAGKSPELARRYRVTSWPTDVFVTPSGLEVYRSISPPRPDQYVAMVSQVAIQSGVGNRRPATPWNQGPSAGQPLLPSVATSHLAGRAQPLGDPAQNIQQRSWSPQAAEAASHYSAQGGDSFAQFQNQSGTGNPYAGGGQYAQQPAYDPHHRVDARAQQLGDAVRSTAQQWQQALEQSRPNPQSVVGTPIEPNAARSSPPAAPPSSAVAGVPTPPPLYGGPPPGAPPANSPVGPSIRESAPTGVVAALPTENPWLAAPLRSEPASPTSPSGPQEIAKVPSVYGNDSPPPDAASPVPAYGTGGNQQTEASAAQAQPSLPTSAAPLLPMMPEPQFDEAPELAQQPTSPAAVEPLASTPPPARDTSASDIVNAPASQTPPNAAPSAELANNSGLVPASKAPPLALDGYCPVTLLETMETKGAVAEAWKKGNTTFGAVHRGKTYLFASEQAQQKFLADPDAYSPVLAGCDPVRYAETGELQEGKRTYGLVYGKRIFLFVDEASLNRFDETPAAFAETAYQAMLRSEPGNLLR